MMPQEGAKVELKCYPASPRRRAEAQTSQKTEGKSYGASAYTYPKGQPGEMKASELARENEQLKKKLKS